MDSRTIVESIRKKLLSMNDKAHKDKTSGNQLKNKKVDKHMEKKIKGIMNDEDHEDKTLRKNNQSIETENKLKNKKV